MKKRLLQTIVLVGTALLCSSIVFAMQNPDDARGAPAPARVVAQPAPVLEFDAKDRYMLISKRGAAVWPADLDTFLAPKENRSMLQCLISYVRTPPPFLSAEYGFSFVKEGAKSHRIINSKNRVLNVEHAFGPHGDKSVTLKPNDGTWRRHRRFCVSQTAEGYYQFFNEESRTLLGVCTETGHLKAFSRSSGNDLANDTLFKLIPVLRNPKPTPSPTRTSINISFPNGFIWDMMFKKS